MTCDGGLQGLMATGKYSVGIIQKMAALYGLKSSQQGTGKRKYVMVQFSDSSPRPHVPTGSSLLLSQIKH